MSDDIITQKVISIFQRHPQGVPVHIDLEGEEGELVTSPDGYKYFTIKQSARGTAEELALKERAETKHYMIKMMEVHHDNDTIRLNNYHIPGERLEEFLLSLSHRPGKILEIKQFIPDHMA